MHSTFVAKAGSWISWHLELGTCGMQENITTLVMVILLACVIGVYGLINLVSRMRQRGPHMLPSSPMLAQGSLQSSPFGPAMFTAELTENIDTMAIADVTHRPLEPTDTLGLSLPAPRSHYRVRYETRSFTHFSDAQRRVYLLATIFPFAPSTAQVPPTNSNQLEILREQELQGRLKLHIHRNLLVKDFCT